MLLYSDIVFLPGCHSILLLCLRCCRLLEMFVFTLVSHFYIVLLFSDVFVFLPWCHTYSNRVVFPSNVCCCYYVTLSQKMLLFPDNVCFSLWCHPFTKRVDFPDTVSFYLGVTLFSNMLLFIWQCWEHLTLIGRPRVP